MRVLIVEDETRIAKYLANSLREILDGRLRRLDIRARLDEAEAFLDGNRIDLLLLDLNLTGRDGFALLQNLVARRFHVIVVSAYRDKAVEAFGYGVLDFVAKPFTKERLQKALARLEDEGPGNAASARFLAIRRGGGIRLLAVSDVVYFKGARTYSEVHPREGGTELHDKSLNQLAAILPRHFQRIHRSYLVNMLEAAEVKVGSGSRYALVLKNGETLPIGRTRYKVLRGGWL